MSVINNIVLSVENEASFSITCVSVDDVLKEIKRLDLKTQEWYTNKSYKALSNLFVYFFNKNVNSCLTEGTFPNDFKKAVVHATHKNECKTINQ